MRPFATIGAAARRADSELPRPACTLKTRVRVLPNASCPIDLVGLPPDWVQSVLATAGGRLIGNVAVAGSTATSPSPVSTAIRCPSTGVLALPFLNTPQPAAANVAAIRMARRKYFFVVILGPTGPGSG